MKDLISVKYVVVLTNGLRNYRCMPVCMRQTSGTNVLFVAIRFTVPRYLNNTSNAILTLIHHEVYWTSTALSCALVKMGNSFALQEVVSQNFRYQFP